MKKIFLPILFLFLLQIAAISESDTNDAYNSAANMRAARKISQIGDVYEVAVLSCKKYALVGIRTKTNNFSEDINTAARLAVQGELPHIRKITVEIETDRALDIIELAHSTKLRMKKQFLVRRFYSLINS